MHKLKMAGVEVEFRESLEKAAEAHDQEIPKSEIDRAARRLATSTTLVNGSKILWIDDNPENNKDERKLLEGVGARVDLAGSSEIARKSLLRTRYDLILSDIARGSDHRAGINFVECLANEKIEIPVILYVGQVKKPTPPNVFGITNRPDELLHLILDALARRRS